MPTFLEVLQGATPAYPTQETIMATEQKHKPEVIAAVKAWKKETWLPAVKLEDKQSKQEAKLIALSALLGRLAEIYEKPVEIEYSPELFSCMYSPDRNKIILNGSLSIISALHEFAHHLFGASETKACRWSVWLFKKTFPKSFEQLEWRGHMLVRKPCPVST